MSLLEHIEEILAEAGIPLHYVDITERLLDRGQWEAEGNKPEALISARLILDIKNKGELSHFEQLEPGFFALRRASAPEPQVPSEEATPATPQQGTWSSKDFAQQFQRHNEEVQRQLRVHLYRMAPRTFETLLVRLLKALGFEEVLLLGYYEDGSLDLRGTIVAGGIIRTTVLIQVRRWKEEVLPATIQTLRGSLAPYEQGLLLTTSDISHAAQAAATVTDEAPVALIDGAQFVALLVEHEIGIVKNSYQRLDLASFGE